MLEKLWTYIEETRITISNWFYAILGISFLRTFIENFINPDPHAGFTTTAQTFVHFTLFYFCIILVTLLILHFFSKQSIVSTAKTVLFGILVIFLPPIIDLIVTEGSGTQLGYLRIDPYTFFDSLTTYILLGSPHISVGIRIECLFLMILIFLFVHHYTKSILRGVCASIAFYVIFFMFYTIPSYLGFGNINIWILHISESLIGQNSFNQDVSYLDQKLFIQKFTDIILSHAYYLMALGLSLTSLFLLSKKKVTAILKNSRPERVIHYFAMLTLGMFIAVQEKLVTADFAMWTDVTSVLIAYISYYCVWMYAVTVNDEVDLEADKLSNKTRPLVTGEVDKVDMKTASLLFLIFALLGGYILGNLTFYMILVFIGLSHIYSMNPLRLKRFPIVNSFIISLAALSTVLSGFYLVSIDHRIDAFPLSLGVLIVIIYTLFSNIKDIKDVEGDRIQKVYTIPVLFGPTRGKQIISIFITVGLCAIPAISNMNVLWYITPPFVLASYYILNKIEFDEKKLFILYFLYMILATILIAL
jgi:4-hydroxybenzoate polyprenyltransferase